MSRLSADQVFASCTTVVVCSLGSCNKRMFFMPTGFVSDAVKQGRRGVHQQHGGGRVLDQQALTIYAVSMLTIPCAPRFQADEVFTSGTAVVVCSVGSITYMGQRRQFGEKGQPGAAPASSCFCDGNYYEYRNRLIWRRHHVHGAAAAVRRQGQARCGAGFCLFRMSKGHQAVAESVGGWHHVQAAAAAV